MTAPSHGWRLDHLAEIVQGRLIGPAERTVRCMAPTDDAGPDALTFVSDPQYLALLADSAAAAALLAPAHLSAPRPSSMAVIVVDDPYVAFARAAGLMDPGPPRPTGVHPSAVVESTARLGAGVALAPFAYVGPRAVLGDRVVLHAGAHVQADAVVGADTVLYDHAVVRHGCRVGARCILHPAAVVGADGFGHARPPPPARPVRIPQLGGVVIDDDVEIGANSAVDRGTFGDTRVGRGAKIDNLVQVGHNVQVGEGCILVAQSGMAGSSRLGDHAALGAQAGISGRVVVGPGATVYGQAGVIRDVPPGTTVAGTPAEPRGSFFRTVARLRKLDGWGERVRQLERVVRGLTTGQ